jgi:endonuclease YncB( thermonuclease family)
MSQSPFGKLLSLSRKEKFLIYLTIVIVYALVSSIMSMRGGGPELSPAQVPGSLDVALDHYLVTKIIDGDTIQISENGKIDGPKKTVRYIGIDTPETVSPGDPIECFGKEAAAKNAELVLGKSVRLEKDISETDRYGRLLRYAYLDSNQGEIFINITLIQEGYASASAYPPDVKHRDEFREAEKIAREAHLGLWGEVCN